MKLLLDVLFKSDYELSIYPNDVKCVNIALGSLQINRSIQTRGIFMNWREDQHLKPQPRHYCLSSPLADVPDLARTSPRFRRYSGRRSHLHPPSPPTHP
jgi:hypothetical protein